MSWGTLSLIGSGVVFSGSVGTSLGDSEWQWVTLSSGETPLICL